MKVKELIEKLSDLDPELPVGLTSPEDEFSEVRVVEVRACITFLWRDGKYYRAEPFDYVHIGE